MMASNAVVLLHEEFSPSRRDGLVVGSKMPSSEEEWDVQRDRIRQLYLDEGKILKEVMTVMEHEHAFKATSVERRSNKEGRHLIDP
jgi:hypothetical protein